MHMTVPKERFKCTVVGSSRRILRHGRAEVLTLFKSVWRLYEASGLRLWKRIRVSKTSHRSLRRAHTGVARAFLFVNVTDCVTQSLCIQRQAQLIDPKLLYPRFTLNLSTPKSFFFAIHFWQCQCMPSTWWWNAFLWWLRAVYKVIAGIISMWLTEVITFKGNCLSNQHTIGEFSLFFLAYVTTAN